MSKKYRTWNDMNVLDQKIKSTFPSGPNDGKKFTMEFSISFEKYNHFEDWGSGYRITGEGIIVDKEYLDDAINEFCNEVIKRRNND